MVLEKGEIQQVADPVSLYQTPSNLFVARFIGSPIINTFAKSSAALNPNSAFAELNWATIGVRSEHFRLGTADNYLVRGKVVRVEAVGKDITVHLEWEGDRFVVSNLEGDLEVGQEIYLQVPAERLLFFQEDQRRILSESEREG